MSEQNEKNLPKKPPQPPQNQQNQLEQMQELMQAMQQQMSQMAGRIEDLSRENRNLQNEKEVLEGRLRYLDANTIADRARKILEATIANSKNKGKHGYYITIKDYLLPIGPFYCDETDPVYVIARYERFYKTKFDNSKNELLTEREWLARTAS